MTPKDTVWLASSPDLPYALIKPGSVVRAGEQKRDSSWGD